MLNINSAQLLLQKRGQNWPFSSVPKERHEPTAGPRWDYVIGTEFLPDVSADVCSSGIAEKIIEFLNGNDKLLKLHNINKLTGKPEDYQYRVGVLSKNKKIISYVVVIEEKISSSSGVEPEREPYFVIPVVIATEREILSSRMWGIITKKNMFEWEPVDDDTQLSSKEIDKLKTLIGKAII